MAAEKGYKVVGVESSAAAMATGQGRIEKSVAMLLGKQVKKGTVTQEAADAKAAATMGNLSFSTDQSALADCDLVVEAIVEDINVKVGADMRHVQQGYDLARDCRLHEELA